MELAVKMNKTNNPIKKNNNNLTEQQPKMMEKDKRHPSSI